MQNRQPCGAPWPTDQASIDVAWDSRSLEEHLVEMKRYAQKLRARLILAIRKGWDIAEAMDVIYTQPHKDPGSKGCCLSAQRRLSNGNYAS